MRTERLFFRKPETTDANFILSLVNDPDWLKFIGNRQVSTNQEAISFILDSLNVKQPQKELGLRVCCIIGDDENKNVINKDTPIGLCGLLQRDYLDAIDIGYAFSKEYRGQGYAVESALLFQRIAFEDVKSDKLYATVLNSNQRSIKLLNKLGFELKGGLVENEVESQTTLLYECYPK